MADAGITTASITAAFGFFGRCERTRAYILPRPTGAIAIPLITD
ncbi:MAG: hypothetical protein V7K97_18530 [Nostoc sp.]